MEIQCFNWEGRLERILRLRESLLDVTQAQIDGYIERFMESSQGERPNLRTMLAEMPYPHELPAFDDLLVDDTGHLWARRFRPDDRSPEVWSVFGIEGQLVAEVSAPAGFQILFVGHDEVLARWLDEFDVEYVVVLPMMRTLVVGEITLAVIALVHGAVFTQTARWYTTVDPGMATEERVALTIDTGFHGLGQTDGRQLLEDVVRRTAASQTAARAARGGCGKQRDGLGAR